MFRTLLAALAALAVVACAALAQAETVKPLTRAEQAAIRRAIYPAAKAHIAGRGQHYLKPSISIPGKAMKRLPNGAIQAEVAISAMGFDWSPIPKRMVQETATFVKAPRSRRVRTTGWVQKIRSNPAGE